MGRKEKQREDRYIDRYNAALGVFPSLSFYSAVKLLRSAFDCTYPYKIRNKEIEGCPYIKET